MPKDAHPVKIKHKGATYVLADPPKEINYRGAKYVLAADVQFSEEERRQAEQQVIDKYERGQQLLQLWPKIQGFLDSSRQALDSYENTLSQAASAAKDAFFSTTGGLKAITTMNYDEHVYNLVNGDEGLKFVQNVLASVSDNLAQSKALLEQANRFRNLFEQAVYTETDGMVDPEVVKEVTRSKSIEVRDKTLNNLWYIFKHYPPEAISKLPKDLQFLYKKLKNLSKTELRNLSEQELAELLKK